MPSISAIHNFNSNYKDNICLLTNPNMLSSSALYYSTPAFRTENNKDYEQSFDDYVLLSQCCYLEKRCRTKLFSMFEPIQAYAGLFLNVIFFN